MFSVETVYLVGNQLTCLWCSPSKLRFSSSPSKRSGAITTIIDGKESLMLLEPVKYSLIVEALLFVWFVACLCSLVFYWLSMSALLQLSSSALLPLRHISSDKACMGFETPRDCQLLGDLNCSCLGRKIITVALPFWGHMGKGVLEMWRCLDLLGIRCTSIVE